MPEKSEASASVVGRGRPREWHEQDAAALCDYMEQHTASIRRAADALGIPLVSAHRTLSAYPDQWGRYQTLQAALAEHWESESAKAAEDAWARVLDTNVDAKRANAVASAGRTLSERYAWRARVADPSRYGDRVTHSGTLRHEAVVLLPQLRPLAAPDQADSAQAIAPQRVGVAARLSAPAPDQADSALGDDAP